MLRTGPDDSGPVAIRREVRTIAAPAPKDIRIVVGLGNPGAEYERTRHNAGFATVDALAERHGARYWKSECGCLVASVRIGGREVILAKPQDFMNTSGGPVSKLCRKEHVSPAELLVIHDEVDLAEGEVRAKFGGGLNAHNGLRSLKDKLGTADFSRIRFGVGRPQGKMDVATYVLRELKGAYLESFEVTAQVAADLVEKCIESGVASQL
jgi:PTH1 family peptidyl-tRNA hydrolase